MPRLFIDKATQTSVLGPWRCSGGSATSVPAGVQSTSGSLIKISSPPSARWRSGGGPAAALPRPRFLSGNTRKSSVVSHRPSLFFLASQNSARSSDKTAFPTLAAAATRTAVTTRLVTHRGEGWGRARDPTGSISPVRSRRGRF